MKLNKIDMRGIDKYEINCGLKPRTIDTPTSSHVVQRPNTKIDSILQIQFILFNLYLSKRRMTMKAIAW